MDFIHGISDAFHALLSLAKPDTLREIAQFGGYPWIGYAIISAIIFRETGLLVGFFLPGDSLLFTVGFLCGTGIWNFTLMAALLIAAAILGDAVNYHIGRSVEHGSQTAQPHLRRCRSFLVFTLGVC